MRLLLSSVAGAVCAMEFQPGMTVHENDTPGRRMHHGDNEHAGAIRMMSDVDADSLHHFVAWLSYNLVRVAALYFFFLKTSAFLRKIISSRVPHFRAAMLRDVMHGNRA